MIFKNIFFPTTVFRLVDHESYSFTCPKYTDSGKIMQKKINK